MFRSVATASRSPRFVSLGLALVAVACSDTTEPPAASRLAFTVSPTTTLAGATIVPAVVIAVQDEAGNLVTSGNHGITLTLTGHPSGLEGSTTSTTVDGIATFAGLRITAAGNAHTLTATSGSLASETSAPFIVQVGPPVKLGFVVQPVTAIGRVPMAPVQVAVQDAVGNTVTSATSVIGIALEATGPSATLSGTTSTAAVNGVATFADLRLDVIGNGFKLVASLPGLSSATSASFSVTSGAAARLEFGIEPWTAKPGEHMAPAITVSVVDAYGNVVSNAITSVSLAIGQNPAGGVLAGTTTKSSVQGVAQFPDISIDRLGSNYTLKATAGSLTQAETAPFAVKPPLTFTVVSSGYFHSCGVATDNASYCWGLNFGGELGNPRVTEVNVPVPVFGGQAFTRISAGRNHSCALTADGSAYCWGANYGGQLGDGTTEARSTPSPVTGGLRFSEVSAGYNHTCAVTNTGVGYCWGGNASGELGSGTVSMSHTPIAVSGGLTFASISTGRLFTCGRTVSGAAYCWGANMSGQLGDDTRTDRHVPTLVQGGLTFSSVSAGGFHSCGITTNGTARCWGENGVGQMGTGGFVSANIPMPVSGGFTFASITAGNRHTCGITTGGASYCWGENNGYLGDGSTTNRPSPAPVSGGHSFAALSAGRFHSCGVTVTNEAYCWGDNSSGRMGIGPTLSSLIPVRVR